MNISFGVISCLYSGISDKIKFTKAQIEYGLRNEDYESNKLIIQYYDEIVETVDFYKEYCMVSAKFLQDQLDELTEMYQSYITAKAK